MFALLCYTALGRCLCLSSLSCLRYSSYEYDTSCDTELVIELATKLTTELATAHVCPLHRDDACTLCSGTIERLPQIQEVPGRFDAQGVAGGRHSEGIFLFFITD